MATLLIVEDRPVDRKLLASVLRADGHEVIEASDGDEALQLFAYQRFDLLISDILMPSMDGYELVRRMRAIPELAQTPVLFYTATYHEHEARELARRCGVADILKKPTAPSALTAKVSALLGSTRVANVGDRTPADSGAFERDHLHLVNTKLAGKIADLEQSEQRMSAVVDMTRELAEERDPQRLLTKVCHAAREATLAQHAIIRVLRDAEGLPPVFIMSGGDDALARRLEPLPPDEPIMTDLLARRPIRMQNPDGDPAALGLPESHRPIFSALIVPLATASRMHGWLAMRNKVGADAFTEADEHVALALATHGAIAYENAALYAALRDSQDRTRFALDVGAIGVWEWDVPADRVKWDDSTARVFGRGPHEVPHTSAGFFALVHPDDLARVSASVQRSLSLREDLRMEFRTVAPDGATRVIDTRARVLYDTDARPLRILGVVVNVTERRALEEQFRQAQKMEAVGRLAGGVAHDFNNMLTAIIGYAEFIAAEPGLSESALADLEQITRAADRSAALTRQLLAFSRTQVLQPRKLDLNTLVTDTMQMLRRVIGEDIELVTALAADLAPLFADPVQIEQIVLNLAVNARDAMPEGGRLTIETGNLTLDVEDAGLMPDASAGRFVMLAVSDTGIGMDETTQRRIFEPFFTTKEHGKGTGLGLATVFGIVKQSGGHVWVYSEPGQGASFKIYLPSGDPTAVSPPSPPLPPRLSGGSEALLLVEDEEAVRQLTRLILERAGYTVVEAADPEAAEAEFARHGDRIALLITDVVMPKASGPALYQKLSAERPSLRVLYTSGYADSAVLRDRRLDEGAFFLQKPYTAAALKEQVREILDR